MGGDGLIDEDDEFVPADESHIFIPRFWIRRADGEKLKQEIDATNRQGQNLEARLSGEIKWENQTGQNVRGFLPGADPQLKDEMVVISAYYDSMSVVPSIAPGAEPTSGIATLLELARILGSEGFRPGRSVLFVATGAHFQGLSGMRAFMDGISQDVVGEIADSAGTPTMHGLRRGLDKDLYELEELGRKIVLSIDRNVLVNLPSDFYSHVRRIDNDLDSLLVTLEGLSETQNKIVGL